MNDTSPITREKTEMIDVLLKGGPASLGIELRRPQVPSAEEKIKVLHQGGYEHFERSGADVEAAAVVFSWTGRTRIAE